jgi:hypothetical protein
MAGINLTPGNSVDVLCDVAVRFQRTLEKVESALADAWAPNRRWGVARFREESLVALLGESLHADGWAVRYEETYHSTAQRTDLSLGRGSDRLWVEAKWWWDVDYLQQVLRPVRLKLVEVKGRYRPIALVFTVDECPARGWTVKGAHDCLRGRVVEEGLANDWALISTAAIESPYHGTTTDEPRRLADRPGGVFAASFFELK